MPDFNINGLDPRSFEHFIQAIAKKVIAIGVTPFGDGPDGGREATFTGKMNYPSIAAPWDGYLVIQSKFKLHPTGNPKEDGEWLIEQLNKDLAKFQDPKRGLKPPEYYLATTNIRLSAVARTGTRDRVDALLQTEGTKLGLKGHGVWGYDDLCRFLETNHDIRKAYSHLITSGDVLAEMHENLDLFKNVGARKTQMSHLIERFKKERENDEVFSGTDSNITMHQLLRLLFVDQMSPPDSLFIFEQFDSPFTRKTVFDLLVGLFDDTLYSDELALRAARQKEEETKTRIDALLGAMADLEQEVDPAVLESTIKEKQAQLVKISDHLRELAAQPVATAAPAADDSLQLQKEFEKVRLERAALSEELARVELEVEDSEQFIAELTQRAQALNESAAIRNILGTLEIQFCPQCLQPLKAAHDEHFCKLCGQQLPVGETSGQRLRLQQELAMQIRESSALLEGKRVKLQQLQARLPSVRKVVEQAEQKLKEALSKVTSQRNRELDELYQKRGALESEVGYLLKFYKAATTFSSLRDAAARLAADVRQLELRIETKRRTQVQRRSLADAHISDNAVQFLRADIPSEEHFEVAQKVTVDVGVNSFAVDGRNQFSASSVTYLRNAVHFAFLFSSLELDFFRYPRLIICDNIEDKGMVAARSQNFQHLIVDRSAKSLVEHQIIFTTSMIAQDLNSDTYCIGDEYTHENKSLKV